MHRTIETPAYLHYTQASAVRDGEGKRIRRLYSTGILKKWGNKKETAIAYKHYEVAGREKKDRV